MKRKINKIIKSQGAVLKSYKTYRSNMGCQIYEIKAVKNNKVFNLDDGYYIGDPNGKENMLQTIFNNLNK